MKIGLTYDLRQEYLDAGYSMDETAEFDRPDTIDSIERALGELGYDTERIGSIRSLVKALAEGRRWDLVFNIAEGLRGVGRESQVPCVLEAYDIPYTFSDPFVLALSLHKGMCKRVLKDLGVPTADFCEVARAEDSARVDLPMPLFVKPVAEGTGKGITTASIIRSKKELKERCAELIERYDQAVLVERYLTGREFTVGVVGTDRAARSVAILEVVLRTEGEDVYSYENKEYCEERVTYTLLEGEPELAAAVNQVALDAWRGLGCRDGGRVDIRLDGDGRPMFLEVNPLAGLHPEHSDLPIMYLQAGGKYVDLIRAIVDSALDRTPHAHRRPA